MATRTKALVVEPDDGPTVSGRAGGYLLRTKATNADTDGHYALQEMTVAAGFPGIPLHIHHHEDEALYGLAGEVTVRVGEQIHPVGAGGFVLMPRDVPHTFANPGPVPARVLVISSPGTVIEYFERAATLTNASPTGQPDMAQLRALAAEYGIEFVQEPA